MSKIFHQIKYIVLSVAILSASSCKMPFAKSEKTDDGVSIPTSGKYLYVASGACYAGGVPTNAPANIVVKYDLLTGNRIRTIADYRRVSPGDSPISISNLDNESLVVSIENANARRIDVVKRDGTGVFPFLFNTTAFSTTLRNLVTTADGSFLVTRAAAVEKFTSFKTRYLNGVNAYISNPTPTACAGMNTALTFSLELPNGNVVIGSAAATPNNKIASLNALGYNSAADCLSSKVGPTTTALPTAAVNVSSNTFLVSYASASAADNQIVSYQYTPSTTNLGTATTRTLVSNPSSVFGASAMAFDPDTGTVFVANSPSGGERIERFTWDATAGTLTRIGSAPFIQSPELTCVSGMYVGW